MKKRESGLLYYQPIRKEGDCLQDLCKNQPVLMRDAVRLRGVSKGVLFHTDRGCQFTSADFRKVIGELGVVQPFSAKGHTYDNAVMEYFFKYLKKEELDRRPFQSVEQLKQSLVSYISGYYNPLKPHSHNHGLPPNQVESIFFQNFACPLY